MIKKRCSYHDEPLPCRRCNSEEAYEREFDAEGRTRPSPYPCRGYVWFDDGEKYSAAIYGTWNGWAIATVPKKVALKMLTDNEDLTVVNATSTRVDVRTESMGETDSIPSSGKLLFFGPGWSLHHSCSKGGHRPPALPKHWQRLCGDMES